MRKSRHTNNKYTKHVNQTTSLVCCSISTHKGGAGVDSKFRQQGILYRCLLRFCLREGVPSIDLVTVRKADYLLRLQCSRLMKKLECSHGQPTFTSLDCGEDDLTAQERGLSQGQTDEPEGARQ